MIRLVADNERLFAQILGVLAALPDRVYSGEDEPLTGTPIGGHVRHVLEHHQALLEGLGRGRVDYDARPRDVHLERDRKAAITATERLSQEISRLRTSPDVALLVALRTGAFAEGTPGDASSSLARELHFVLLHAVHHLAMVAVELRLRGLPCDPDLGVAPATLGWQLSQTA